MSSVESNIKVAIVISSCDAFCDCWAPFIYSIKKYWSNCEFPIYLISNNKEDATISGVSFIKVGEDKWFASNLKYALHNINADYIIYLQEDYFLNRTIDNDAIKQHIFYCFRNNVDYMRMGSPFIKGKNVDIIYTENDMMTKYALCLQAAIWKKSTLETLLLEGWSGWDFEYKIQEYAKQQGIKLKVLGINKKNRNLGINYIVGTAVRKGKWTRTGYNFLRNEGFSHLIKTREVEGFFFFHLQEVQGILRLPALCIVKIMKILRWNF